MHTLTPVDYGYVDTIANNIRYSLGIRRPAEPIASGVLLSIHVQSNRPDNFVKFLDDLEASIDDPANIEVVVKIDDTDAEMNALLPLEVAKRPFAVKYLSTPLVGGFFELWRSMNDMLNVCDPNAYFLWNMNDEMAVLNKGWDSMLKKYVGLFPDHIFRLRTSLFRSRNYCDFWECGFAPETSAITTKRWIDIGGNWNPCLGPDSFQQCVAYYFAYHDRFNKFKPLREVPIHDITLAGEGAFIGLEGEKLWKRMRGATKAWFRLMSPKIQTEASRRAQKLHAHVCATNNRLTDFTIQDHAFTETIVLTDNETGLIIRKFPYHLSYTRIWLTNGWRAARYLYYGGGGARAIRSLPVSIITFLSLRYKSFEWVYRFSHRYRKWRDSLLTNTLQAASMLYVKNKLRLLRLRRKILNQMQTSLSWTITGAHHIRHQLRRLYAALVGELRSLFYDTPVWSAFKTIKHYNRHTAQLTLYPFRILRELAKRSALNVLNRGYAFDERNIQLTRLDLNLDWHAINVAMLFATLPERFVNPRFRNATMRCILLKHWYNLTDQQLQEALLNDVGLRYFLGLRAHQRVPTISAIRALQDMLTEENVLPKVFAIVDAEIAREQLPKLGAISPAIPAESPGAADAIPPLRLAAAG